MKMDFLKSLHCPYCASTFQVSACLSGSGMEVSWGIVECACARYPIVEGILALSAPNHAIVGEAVLSLERKRPKDALLALLEPQTAFSRISRAIKAADIPLATVVEWTRLKYRHRRLSKIIKALSFAGAVSAIRNASGAGYFGYRYVYSSFIAALPLISLISLVKGPVLEIGSGMGHLGFYIHSLYPDRSIVMTDFSFLNLYLSRKFFVPQAEYVCLDANAPLPFSDAGFNVAFSSDTMHYLRCKKSAVAEIERVLAAKDSLLLFSHLHNSLANEPVQGASLDACGWLGLFCRMSNLKLLGQSRILRDFLSEGILDLTYSLSEKERMEEGAFSLVAAQDEGLFKAYDDCCRNFFAVRDNLAVNALYRMRYVSGQARLEKRWPSKFMRDENSAMDAHFTQSLCLEDGFIKAIVERRPLPKDDPRIDELMRKFILVNLPKRYYCGNKRSA